MRNYGLLFIYLCFCSPSFAQITGKVVDESGDPLPYVNIYIQNSTIGTTTNLEGVYTLQLGTGNYTVVYQYVGFKSIAKRIEIDNNKNQVIDLTLVPETYEMDEIVIAADAEDPAYAIIRKAQAKRKFHKDQLTNYECDVYMRGINRITSAPEKIMGIDIGDMEGMLDSTRQGIVYLSESVSRLYVKDGQQKEIMHSSKVSGEPQGYSFNSAREMTQSFYDNTFELNRYIVSPIANNALSHYNYRLEGVSYDGGFIINKIKVLPKNKFGNVFFGYVYIVEDLWNLHSVDLSISKEATQLPFVDTINFKVIFSPTQENLWVTLSNVVSFKVGAMGFGLEGSFAAVYSDYQLDEVKDELFSKVVYKVLEEANLHDERYWDSIRPIPLTVEEETDYIKKDSIRMVRESPAYLDSIDAVANKFKPLSLLFGYTRQNSQTRESFSYSSPIGDIGLNTIQGWNSSLGLGYSKYFNKQRNRRIGAGTSIGYGLSEKVIRPHGYIEYQDGRHDNVNMRMEGGKKMTQYSNQEPIAEALNFLFTSVFRRNYLKAYDKEYLRLSLARDLGNTVRIRTSLDYENRNALVNHYRTDQEKYTSNNPQDKFDESPAFENHQALILRLSLRFQFDRDVWSHPNQTFKMRSKWPILDVYYKGGLKALGGDVDYHLLYASLTKSVNAGIYGDSYLRLMGGGFIGDGPAQFIDYFHFLGNQTHVANTADRNRFFLLPYYSHSADESFVQGHFTHKFKGFLLSKAPLLKHTQFQLVTGYKFVKSNQQAYYDEFHIGLENVGIGIARIFRIDAVFAHDHFDCGPLEDCTSGRSFGVVVSSAIML